MNERDTKEMEKIRQEGERFLKLGCIERGWFFYGGSKKKTRVEETECSDSVDKVADSDMLDSQLIWLPYLGYRN